MGFMNKVLKEDLFLVDFTYQLEIAKKAKEAGAQGISLISAVGSNSHSRNHYLKTKGMLESEIMELDFESINIYQPGHLRGIRAGQTYFLQMQYQFLLIPSCSVV